MKIDRMDLADVGSNPRLVAEAVLAQISDVSIPIPVEEIAYAVDIREIRTERLGGLEGALVTDSPEKADASILVNLNSPPERRRYTVGHELGHYLLPLHVPSSTGSRCTSDDMRRTSATTNSGRRRSKAIDKSVREEIQANEFAAELLLPRKLFRLDLQRRELDLSHVCEIAVRYAMSKEATARRYVMLHDEPSAVVFSKSGVVRYVIRHEEFPWVDVRPGGPVPKDSITARWRKAGDGVSDWDELEAGIWVSDETHETLLEQTLIQRHEYQMTLLAFGEEVDEEERSLADSWTPRFSR